MSWENISPADIAAVNGNGNNRNGFFEDIVALAALGMLGFGGGWGNNWGGMGGMMMPWMFAPGMWGMGNAGSNCATAADIQRSFDTQTLINKANGLENGICSLGYDQLAQMNGINANVSGVGAGVQAALVQQGYENRLGQNDIRQQIADCCCTTQQNIKDGITQGVMNTNALQQQIQSCCCDAEKTAMQARYDAQTYNCNTLQAIDRLGDRIIGHMEAGEKQALRDEVQALRLAASQSRQDALITASANRIIDRLSPPDPVPSFTVPNPITGRYGIGNWGGCPQLG